MPAAAYLQRAGASVALVERADRCGSFFKSYERGEGVRFDVAPVNVSCVSPALADLELAEHGYRIDFPDVLWSRLDGAGASPNGSAVSVPPASWARISCVRRTIRAERSVGSARASSKAFVWIDRAPPATAESACTATRAMLFSGC